MEMKFTLDRFEGDKALLISENKEDVVWPADKLPPGCREGEVLVFEIMKKTEAENSKRQTAKEILNEILNSED